MLQIQSKRFYLDVKQNRRGRFIKVAEIGADGRRSQIFLALSTAAEFRDHLSAFSDYYSSLGPPNPDNVPEDGKLKSEMMLKDNRRYYLDLKENSRGRFLRVSQTITRGGPRSQVAIPAQGMIEFRDALTDLLDEFSVDEAAYRQELPEGKHLHVDNKNFYFDIGQNARGVYMRISEVKTNFRTAITVPEKSWPRFRDILADYCDKMKQQQAEHTLVSTTARYGVTCVRNERFPSQWRCFLVCIVCGQVSVTLSYFPEVMRLKTDCTRKQTRGYQLGSRWTRLVENRVTQ